MNDLEYRVERMIDEALPPLDPNDIDRVRDRLLSEHHARTTRRLLRRPRRRASRIVALVTACLAVAGGVAIAAEPGIADRILGRLWFTHHAADEAFNDAPDASPLEPSEIEHFQRLFGGAPVRPSSDHGPILDEMRPFEEGRVLYEGPAGRLAGLASDRGDVCYVLSRNGSPVMGSCVGDLPKTGVSFSVFRDGARYVIPAIVASDVTDVSLRLRNGEQISVPLGDNGFVWDVQAADTPNHPVELIATRNDATHEVPVILKWR